MCRPSWKTLNNRFKNIVSDHCIAVQKNAVASGIIEVRGERELLLHDIVLTVDEWEEGRRAERDEKTDLDRHLRLAGETIRSNALNRARHGSAEDEKEGSGEEGLRNQQRKRKAAALEPDDEDCSAITEHISEQREYDRKRLRLEEEKLECSKAREVRESERWQKVHDKDLQRIAMEEKRIELEERRLDLEKEERKSGECSITIGARGGY